jgi:uncharacterized iron-regulated membrane protein
MAALNLANPSLSGTVETYAAAAAAGDSFPLGGPIVVKAKNASGAARNVTVVAQRPCNQGFTHSPAAINIADGVTKEIKIADVNRFANSSGRVELTYDVHTGLSVLAYSAG